MDPEILRILPVKVSAIMKKMSQDFLHSIEEIRIRTERPVEIISSKVEGFLTQRATLSLDPKDGVIITKEESLHILNLISNHSLYALEEELKRGYVTIAGGHRIGMTGKVVLENGEIAHLKDITGFNIRIAKEMKGTAEALIPYLWNGNKVMNSLIISPPRCGKTTILRDLVRLFSYGSASRKIPGHKIGLVDERSELAGCVNGIPQKDVGPRTDVLDRCPKAEGMMMLIRSMSPQIIVADEIGRNEDAIALQEAIHAGVSIITTAHGATIEEILHRPSMSAMLRMGIFDRYFVLSKRKGVGTLEGIFDHNYRLMHGVALL